jgi:hypothetical protein
MDIIGASKRTLGHSAMLALGAMSESRVTRTATMGVLNRGLTRMYRPALVGAAVGAGLGMGGAVIDSASNGRMPTVSGLVGGGIRGGLMGGMLGAGGMGVNMLSRPGAGGRLGTRINRNLSQGANYSKFAARMFGG